MTITLQQEPVFTIQVNGQQLTGFTVESEWEGFKKMSRGQEFVILATTKAVPACTMVFGGLLKSFMEGKPASDEYCALMASPSLHGPLKATAQRPAEPDSDDAAVDAFAAVMKEKLCKAREKGRGGWQECTQAELSALLREHVEKGDPRDVANFCMFLHQLGYEIEKQPAEPHLFELWWAEYMPAASQGTAFEAWSAAPGSKGVSVEQPATQADPELRHSIRVHLANRYQYSHKYFCERLDEILAEANAGATS